MENYRKISYSDGVDTKYIIQKNKLGKWVYCFGGLSYIEANLLLENPNLIESEIKKNKKIGICVLIFIIIFIIISIT